MAAKTWGQNTLFQCPILEPNTIPKYVRAYFSFLFLEARGGALQSAVFLQKA